MNARILEVWEEGQAGSPVVRALSLLSLALPEMTQEEREALPIGRRDAALIDLRARIFGREIVSIAACLTCGERIELTFQTDDILIDSPAESAERGRLKSEGYSLTYRLPASRDMLALQASSDVAGASWSVLQACILSATYREEPVAFETLPASVIDVLAARFADDDPQADVRLSLTCPACAESWPIVFDIASFLWIEVQVYAERLLRAIHQLALSYGWSERDILALPAARRQFYLQEIGV